MSPATFDAWQLVSQFETILNVIFGSDVRDAPLTLYQVAARAAAVLLLGLALVRIGKTRMIGRVTALDVLLGFILGSLLSRGITGEASITETAVASATLAALHWLFTLLAYRWHGVGKLLKGNSVLLVTDGEPNEKHLRSSHISKHDLVESLHLHGVESLDEVHLAFEERNGEISVIKRR